MTHDDAFLLTILETPDDDTPRLIYADWLDEHGDTARAEFIRVQCRLAQIDFDDPALPDLLSREFRLRTDHADEWLGELRSSIVGWTFRRGFLDEIVISGSMSSRDLDYETGRLRLARPPTVRRIAVDLTDASSQRWTRFTRPSAGRRRRVRFYAMTDCSVIECIKCGLLFVDAVWSGSSRTAFQQLREVLDNVDPDCHLELVVADNDGCFDLYRTPLFKGKYPGGNGDTVWVKDGQVLDTACGLPSDGFETPTRILLNQGVSACGGMETS